MTGRPSLMAHDEGSERAALGAILIDGSQWPDFAQAVKCDDFFIQRHKLIFDIFAEVHARGEAIDIVTAGRSLNGRSDAIGGPAYLQELINSCPLSWNWPSYIAAIVETAQERRRAVALLEAGRALDAGDWQRAGQILINAGAGPEAQQPQPDTWRLFTLADAFTPRAPLVFLVEGLIVEASLVILYGAPGILKSLILADLAVCVAAGLPWLSSLPGESGAARHVTRCPVMWLDFDNGTRRTHERFEAIGRAYGVPADIPLYYVSMPSPWLNAGDNAAILSLADRIIAHDVKLVILDNLSMIKGVVDENSDQMGPVMSHLRWLAEFTGAAIIVVHHQRKGNGLIGRAGETLRGHGSIEAALDLALLIEREPGASLITIRSTKTRDVEVPPFGAQFTFGHKDGCTELAAARFYGVMVEDTTSDNAIDRAIVEAVTQHHPIMQRGLIDAVKAELPDVGLNRIKSRANLLVTAGKLSAATGAHRAKIYDLP
jgi:hypothetical protein